MDSCATTSLYFTIESLIQEEMFVDDPLNQDENQTSATSSAASLDRSNTLDQLEVSEYTDMWSRVESAKAFWTSEHMRNSNNSGSLENGGASAKFESAEVFGLWKTCAIQATQPTLRMKPISNLRVHRLRLLWIA